MLNFNFGLKKRFLKVVLCVICVIATLLVLTIDNDITFAAINTQKNVELKENYELGLQNLIVNAKCITEYDEDTTIDMMDTVTFGSYPQLNIDGNTKDPIEWIVLDRRDNKALLLSKYILDCKRYNDIGKNVTWRDCTLRNWLNSTFLKLAFNKNEQAYIYTSNLTNGDSETFHIVGGYNTLDKVFCLSIDEAKKYFYIIDDYAGNRKLATRGTKYAKSMINSNSGVGLYVYKYGKWDGNSDFWLRSPGIDEDAAVRVNGDGLFDEVGSAVHSDTAGVRPAIWISY